MHPSWIALGLTALLLTGCAATSSSTNPEIRINRTDLVRADAPELAAVGPFDTGLTSLPLVNHNQIDAVNTTEVRIPRYDRTLTLEIWYPAEAAPDTADRSITTTTRDGTTTATLHGSAARDATPLYSEGPYPLILLSHGYPGNRHLMAHFGENLATKGFVVASIDHMESTYVDQSAFVSTLLNRSLDQNFVLQELALLAEGEGRFGGLINPQQSGIIGFSMGGYGALNTVGAGLSEAAPALPLGEPAQTALLNQRQLSHPDYQASVDPRFKAIIAIGPWGAHYGLWDAAGLANVQVPVMIMAGSIDDVSDYDNGIRQIYSGLNSTDRYLLTFINANHNAAAPIAAPVEVYPSGEGFSHYGDAVWDNTRMNNIAQHFATAFFEQYLKGEDRRAYLELLEEYAADGDEEAGTTWPGFNQRDAVGLRYEFK